jgi:hypothetical protein
MPTPTKKTPKTKTVPTLKAPVSTRKLSSIGVDILGDWKDIPYYAKYYVDAMYYVSYVSDMFECMTGYHIVENFLSEAKGWRGAMSRRIKAELKDILQRSDMR